jgi:acyl-CoA thioesterase I
MQHNLISLSLIAFLIIVIAYVVFIFTRIHYYTNYSKNPEIVQVSVDLEAKTSTHNLKPIKYMAAGDSTAVGRGASSVEKSYTRLIAGELANTQPVEYRNIAVSGARTADVVEKQLQQIIAFQPDIITISISANDATHLISQSEILKNYRTIVERLEAETSADIYITNTASFKGAKLLPWFFVELIEYRSKKLNAKLAELVKSDRTSLVNIHDFGWASFVDPSSTYSYDYFHPSDIGYENWANAFLSYMDLGK